MSEATTGYRFTVDQKALLTQSMELVWEREREPVFIEMGMSDTFEAARLGIEGHAEQPLFALQSMFDDAGVIYAVVKFGPPPELEATAVETFATFADAVQNVADGMASFIREAKRPFRNLQLPALGEEDRQLLRDLAAVLGRSAGRQGFADFRNIGEGAQACAVGVMADGQSVTVASFVGVHGKNGFECSVRNFQNERLPGMPELFPTVAKAIGAHREYFTRMAASLLDKPKPWWKKLF